jgi:hypothetical protein
MDQPNPFLRQREHVDIVRRRHRPYQRRQMEAIGDFRERFWRVRKAERSRCARYGEHRQPIGLIVPEVIDRVRLCVLLLSDIVLVLDIVLGACETIELLRERGNLCLVDTRFLQLRQGIPGEFLERGAIDLGAAAQGRRRQIQGNAGFALDLRERLELLQARNIDMEHRRSPPPAERPSLCPVGRCWLKHHTSALMAVNQGGISSGQANAQQAANPIKAFPHSRSPQSRISFRIGETGFPSGMAKSQIFIGIITK